MTVSLAIASCVVGQFFHCPSGPNEGTPFTNYVAVTGPGTAFPGTNWTCVGICAHESTKKGGELVSLPAFTLG